MSIMDSIEEKYEEEIAKLKIALTETNDEIWHLKGAMKADDLRLVAAAKKAGELDLGCDIPDWLAETILEQRAQIAALKEKVGEATGNYDVAFNEWHRCLEQIAALTTENEGLKQSLEELGY